MIAHRSAPQDTANPIRKQREMGSSPFYIDIISKLVISDMDKYYKLIANKEL